MRKLPPPAAAPRPPSRTRRAPVQLSLLTVAPAPIEKVVTKPARKDAAPKKSAVPRKVGPKTAAKETKRGPAAKAERVTVEAALPVAAGGALWKMSGKNGVAYVRDAALAGELLGIEPKKLALAAMAVYHDKRGRPFAWQVRFDAARWEEILRRLA